MKIIAVIPARFKSSRFPGKPLVSILGKPMIIRVAEIVASLISKKDVYIATDDERIKNEVEKFGFQAIMTSSSNKTGTDRVYEVSKSIDADIYINIQGDEPLISPKDIQLVIDKKIQFPNEVVNGYCALKENENVESTDIPKVIFSSTERLIYMSRLPIPGVKDKNQTSPDFYKQVCIYGFSSNELKLFGTTNSKRPIEHSEDIEILRFLELDHPVRMVKVSKASIAVDRPEDVAKVEFELNNKV